MRPRHERKRISASQYLNAHNPRVMLIDSLKSFSLYFNIGFIKGLEKIIRMDLTKGDITSIIKTIAIPASIGFFFNTMYNVVDTFYAGRISTEALAALSLSFPIFFIIIAMGSGLSQGGTALISNSLGESKVLVARKYSRQVISFGVIISVVLTMIGFIISPFLFRFLGASEQYLQISLDYMNIILIGTIFFISQSILNSSLLAQGDSKTFRNVLVAGFFLNLIFNPMLMYGFGPIPALGIKGIALATIIIQFFGTLYMGYRVSQTKLWNKFKPKNLIPVGKYFRDIAYQGFPASLNMMTVALGIFIITFFISRFGNDGVAAYGIATRIEQIFLVPAIGLNMALLSITGQNNGAKKLDRVQAALKKTLKYGAIIELIGGIVIFSFAERLMGIFTDDASVIAIGSYYLRIAAFILFAYVVLFQFVAMMQGLKNPMFGLYVGIVRQIILPLTLFPLFSEVLGFGLKGIWYGIATIIVISAISVFIIGYSILQKRINVVNEQTK